MQNHWTSVWADKDPEDVSWFEEHPTASLRMLVPVIGVGDRVVDVGAGAARLVDALLDLDARVTVVDVSEGAIALAQRRLGDAASSVNWIVADLRALPRLAVDAWHDRAAFHFLVDDGDRERYVASAKDSVRQGGHLVVAGFADDGPDSCSGLPVRRHDEAQLSAAFADGFAPDQFERVEHRTPWGGVQRFLYGRFVRVFTNERSFG